MTNRQIDFSSNTSLFLIAGLALFGTYAPEFVPIAMASSLAIVVLLGFFLYFRNSNKFAGNEENEENKEPIGTEKFSPKVASLDQIVVIIPSNNDAVMSYELLVDLNEFVSQRPKGAEVRSLLWDEFMRFGGEAVGRRGPDYISKIEKGKGYVTSPDRGLPRNIAQFQ